jgi:hypothetical protein
MSTGENLHTNLPQESLLFIILKAGELCIFLYTCVTLSANTTVLIQTFCDLLCFPWATFLHFLWHVSSISGRAQEMFDVNFSISTCYNTAVWDKIDCFIFIFELSSCKKGRNTLITIINSELGRILVMTNFTFINQSINIILVLLFVS